MRVGAAEAEGIDARQALAVPAGERLELGRHAQLELHEIDVWARGFKMETGRDLAVLQDQHRFKKSRDAGGRLEMAEIGFDRADRERLGAVDAQRVGQRVRFDRIADRRAGAVRFDKTDLLRRDARIGARVANESRLRFRAGERDAVGVPVLID